MSATPVQLPPFLHPTRGDQLRKTSLEGPHPPGTLAVYLGDGQIQIDELHLSLMENDLLHWDITPSPAVGLDLEFHLVQPRKDGVQRLRGLVEDAVDGNFHVRIALAHTSDGPTNNFSGETWVLTRAQLTQVNLLGMQLERELIGGAMTYLLAHQTEYGTFNAYWSHTPPSALVFGTSVKTGGMNEAYDTAAEALAAARAEATRHPAA